jgi:3-deoxy-D-manno-octulosonate 8-phosphate phosphatase (KDO 8-P phosphatase)
LRQLITELRLSKEEAAFVGDDLNDIPAFKEVGLKIAVGNASNDLKALADHITNHPGGSGAVREIIELILKSQGKWESAVQEYLQRLEQSECQT